MLMIQLSFLLTVLVYSSCTSYDVHYDIQLRSKKMLSWLLEKNKVKYLGHSIMNDLCDDDNVQHQCCILYCTLSVCRWCGNSPFLGLTSLHFTQHICGAVKSFKTEKALEWYIPKFDRASKWTRATIKFWHDDLGQIFWDHNNLSF